MPIIDFLLENIFFVLIALFFLSTILSKKKTNEAAREQREREQATRGQQTSRGQGTMSSSGSGSQSSGGQGQQNEFPFPAKSEPVKSKPAYKSESEVVDRYARKVVAKDSPIYSKELDLSKDDTLESDGSVKSVGISLETPSSQDVVKGMVWAEIFGRPRSKNPYRGGPYHK